VFLLCAGGLAIETAIDGGLFTIVRLHLRPDRRSPLESLLDEMPPEQAQDIRDRQPHHGTRDVAWRGELATSATVLVEQLLTR